MTMPRSAGGGRDRRKIGQIDGIALAQLEMCLDVDREYTGAHQFSMSVTETRGRRAERGGGFGAGFRCLTSAGRSTCARQARYFVAASGGRGSTLFDREGGEPPDERAR